jgi:hypothetical protein
MCPVSAAVPMFAGPGWAREAGGLMSNVAVQGERDSPALPEQVRVARAFVSEVLGESDPHIDVALLLAGTAASCRSMSRSVSLDAEDRPGGTSRP